MQMTQPFTQHVSSNTVDDQSCYSRPRIALAIVEDCYIYGRPM